MKTLILLDFRNLFIFESATVRGINATLYGIIHYSSWHNLQQFMASWHPKEPANLNHLYSRADNRQIKNLYGLHRGGLGDVFLGLAKLPQENIQTNFGKEIEPKVCLDFGSIILNDMVTI